MKLQKEKNPRHVCRSSMDALHKPLVSQGCLFRPGNFAALCKEGTPTLCPVTSKQPLREARGLLGQNRWGTNSWGETGPLLSAEDESTVGVVCVCFVWANLVAEAQLAAAPPRGQERTSEAPRGWPLPGGRSSQAGRGVGVSARRLPAAAGPARLSALADVSTPRGSPGEEPSRPRLPQPDRLPRTGPRLRPARNS